MGLSSQPAGGYDKKTQGVDIAMVMEQVNVKKADLGRTPSAICRLRAKLPVSRPRITKWVVIERRCPALRPWDEIRKSPLLLWNFNSGA